MMEQSIDTPILLALRLSEEPELEEGDTGPLKLECAPIDDLINLSTYIVKFCSKVAVSESLAGFGIISELIAAHLARYFGITVPDFALIEISDAFAKSALANANTFAHVLSTINMNKHSLNFGSKFLTGSLDTPLDMQSYNIEELAQAERIFAFDALIYNADRTENAPNVFRTKHSFVVYDHEKAFNFLIGQPISADPATFGFTTRRKGGSFMLNHIFRPILHSKPPTFDEFLDMLQNLNDTIIEQIIQEVPYDLSKNHRKHIEAIRSYLIKARDDSRGFRFALLRSLA